MAYKPKLMEIEVPRELVAKSLGLGLDYGGSVIKIVYRTEEEYQKAIDPDNRNTTAKLFLASFSREFRQEALEFIRANAHISRDKEELPKLSTTGCGSSEYTQEIVDIVQITPEIITEHDCFCKSLYLLTHQLSRDQLLYDFLWREMDEPLRFCEELFPLMRQMANSGLSGQKSNPKLLEQMEAAVADLRQTDFCSLPHDKRPLAEAEDIFPCLLVICGSAFTNFKIEADGSYYYVDGTQFGGRGFYGLGSLLTGSKAYEELIELAERGNHKRVDTHKNDMRLDTGEEDLAAKFGEMDSDSLIFNFGKAVGHNIDDFKPEDLARALLRGFVKEKVEKIRLTAAHHEVKHIFLSGSFINHEIVRRTMTEIFTFCNYFIDAANQKKFTVAKYDFLKAGSHFGALGTLINSVHPFMKTPEKKQE